MYYRTKLIVFYRPGLQEEKSMIPTAIKTLDGKTLWGAQIKKNH